MLHSLHMNLGFWGKIEKPFLALAPMADVTDAAFRRMFVKYSKHNGEGVFDKNGEYVDSEIAALSVVIPAEAGIQSENSDLDPREYPQVFFY